jgi:hypothetical protein
MRKAVSNHVRKAVNTTATRIAGGVTKVAGRAENAVAQVHQPEGRANTGVVEAIRAQPIVAALAAFALGCVVGRLGSGMSAKQANGS